MKDEAFGTGARKILHRASSRKVSRVLPLPSENLVRVDAWSDRLEAMIEQFLIEGVRDGSIVPCETRLVTNLLIGMLISLARWTWRVEGITTDRLMQAIGVASLDGLERRSA